MNSLSAGNSLNNIQRSQNLLAAYMAQLSSGKKINRASDDPAGMLISEQMSSQIDSLQQQITNMEAQTGKLSLTDGYLSSVSAILTEIRSDAVATTNSGTLDENQRDALQESIDNSVNALNATIGNAYYGSQALLDGSDGSVAEIPSLDILDVSTPEKAAEAVEQIDTYSEAIDSARADIGSRQQEDIEANLSDLRTELQNLTEAQSTITDTDYASDVSRMIAEQIKLQAGVSILAQGNLLAQKMP